MATYSVVCSTRHIARTTILTAMMSFALLTHVAAATAGAQAVSGAGDDAIPIPKGGVRFRIGGLWNDYSDVFAPDATGGLTKHPLLSALNTSSLGTRQLPQLAAAEKAIRSLAAQPAYALSLGTFEALGNVRQSSVPMAFDVGITKKLSIGIVVPYVESRDHSQLVLNRAGTSATVGRNPAFDATTGAAARTANGALLRQIALARTTLTAEIARCAVTTATGCDAIRANPTAAQNLLQTALATQSALATVYGDSARGGSPVVPISGSATDAAIAASIGSLRSAFQGFGVASIAATAAPSAATVVYGTGSIGAIGADSAFSLRYKNVGNTRRAGIGDIDLTVTALLHDTFDGDQKKRLNNTGRGVRTSLTAGFRFGSAGADFVENPLDVPIGDGASALLLRSTTDFIANRTFWVSGTLRIVKPFADNVAVALPLLTDSTIFAGSFNGSAARKLAMRTEIEIAPRFMIGQFFGLSGAYLFRRVGTETLVPFALNSTTVDPSIGTDPYAGRTTPARTLQAVTIAASFSSLASYMRGGANFPLELLFSHTQAIFATGAAQPVSGIDRLELKIYRGFPRR
jgi:hypothetical protein